MGAQVPGGLLPGQLGPLPVDEGFGAHQDAGCAETALEGAVSGEGGGVEVPFGGVEALQSDYLRPLSPLHRGLAGHPGPAVDQHGAAAALTGRRTAVLGGDNP